MQRLLYLRVKIKEIKMRNTLKERMTRLGLSFLLMMGITLGLDAIVGFVAGSDSFLKGEVGLVLSQITLITFGTSIMVATLLGVASIQRSNV